MTSLIKLNNCVLYAISVGGISENCRSALEEIQKEPAGSF